MSVDVKLEGVRRSGTAQAVEEFISVGPLEELRQRGCTVVTGIEQAVAELQITADARVQLDTSNYQHLPPGWAAMMFGSAQ
jgi:hypothetical protein